LKIYSFKTYRIFKKEQALIAPFAKKREKNHRFRIAPKAVVLCLSKETVGSTAVSPKNSVGEGLAPPVAMKSDQIPRKRREQAPALRYQMRYPPSVAITIKNA